MSRAPTAYFAGDHSYVAVIADWNGADVRATDLNKRWINGEMRSGSEIVDIDEPAGYPPSVFYNREREQVSGYGNYVQDPQP
jgi:hypothetical protein